MTGPFDFFTTSRSGETLLAAFGGGSIAARGFLLFGDRAAGDH